MYCNFKIRRIQRADQTPVYYAEEARGNAAGRTRGNRAESNDCWDANPVIVRTTSPKINAIARGEPRAIRNDSAISLQFQSDCPFGRRAGAEHLHAVPRAD